MVVLSMSLRLAGRLLHTCAASCLAKVLSPQVPVCARHGQLLGILLAHHSLSKMF